MISWQLQVLACNQSPLNILIENAATVLTKDMPCNMLKPRKLSNKHDNVS